MPAQHAFLTVALTVHAIGSLSKAMSTIVITGCLLDIYLQAELRSLDRDQTQLTIYHDCDAELSHA